MGIVLSLGAFIVVFAWHPDAKIRTSRMSSVPMAQNSPSVFRNIDHSAIAPTSTGVSSAYAKVTKVFDGDTVEIAGGEHVRYIGIDAPEEWYSKKAGSNNQCYAAEAKKENERLVLGNTVRLEKDVRDRDIYGRLLRYVYIPSGPAENVTEHLVGEMLVAGGFAKATPYPPDIKYKDTFSEEEKYAKENKKGLWGACNN